MKKDELEPIELDLEQLKLKERAISAGLVVELEPHEADALGIAGYDEITSEEEEKHMLDSRFDACEFEMDDLVD